MMIGNWFSVPIFLIMLRETLEAGIIISVLISLIDHLSLEDKSILEEEDEKKSNQTLLEEARKKMKRQIWAGATIGFLISLAIGAVFVTVWYTVASDLWSKSEYLWVGCFSVIAAILITVMGIAMLKVDHIQEKWRAKISKLLSEKSPLLPERQEKVGFFRSILPKERHQWALFTLPLVTVLREGIESIVFLGGVSLGEPATSIPLAAIVGIGCGAFIGYLIWRGGVSVKIHYLFAVSTCVLFLIAAGLASKAVWSFQSYAFNLKVGFDPNDLTTLGDGPGTFEVRTMVWHIPGTNPESKDKGGWGVFNAVLGWQQTATYGSIATYCAYWMMIVCVLIFQFFKLKRQMIKKSNKLSEN